MSVLLDIAGFIAQCILDYFMVFIFFLSQPMTTIEIKDTAEGNETYYIELAIPQHTEDGAEVGKKCHSSVTQNFKNLTRN